MAEKFRGQYEDHDYNSGPEVHPEPNYVFDVPADILPGHPDSMDAYPELSVKEPAVDFTYGNGGDFHGSEKIENDTDFTGLESNDDLIAGDPAKMKELNE